jgi:hypothetical protein
MSLLHLLSLPYRCLLSISVAPLKHSESPLLHRRAPLVGLTICIHPPDLVSHSPLSFRNHRLLLISLSLVVALYFRLNRLVGFLCLSSRSLTHDMLTTVPQTRQSSTHNTRLAPRLNTRPARRTRPRLTQNPLFRTYHTYLRARILGREANHPT